jgi:hydroxymethylpyrimidine kinase / phosphomethylpyrimidine kinase / thiamine-phosphate diphosphorylase
LALTIAGSDSSGGAGIQQDLAVFAAWGVHGTSVVTAVTAQNSLGVGDIFLLPALAVKSQLKALLDDIPPRAIKVGMLGNAGIVQAVVESLYGHEGIPLVIDTVLSAKHGEMLIDDDGFTLLKKELLPKATIITPNIPEVQSLLGFEIKTPDDERKAAYELFRLTGAAIVLKGGHRAENRSDLFYEGKEFAYLPDDGLIIDNAPHGTGCAFSASIAAELALGKSVAAAVHSAKRYINRILRFLWQPGAGHPFIIPSIELEREAERGEVLERLDAAFHELKRLPKIERLVPEVGMNIAYCLPFALDYDDVAGFPGRISACDGELVTPAAARFGGSRHTARVVLAAHRICRKIRAAMPIRYSAQAVELLERMGLAVGSFAREEEPAGEVEGETLEWGTTYAMVSANQALDVIYDLGGVGKEPIIRLLAESPHDLVEICAALLELLD